VCGRVLPIPNDAPPAWHSALGGAWCTTLPSNSSVRERPGPNDTSSTGRPVLPIRIVAWALSNTRENRTTG